MAVFKYLNVEHAESWLHGGSIPIFLASSYRSNERSGHLTPDENVQRSLTNMPEYMFKRIARIGPNATAHLNFGTAQIGSDRFENVKFNQVQEDGLVLCFSTKFSPSIAWRFQRNVCVRIVDPVGLLRIVDAQVGVEGLARECEYTKSFQRNHFLKSHEDSWQHEYRMFWKYGTTVKVNLPPGVGVEEGRFGPSNN